MFLNTGKTRVDSNRKIVALIVFGVICAILLVFLVNVSINTSSGIRAYVSSEAYWAKAQKEAVNHLTNYIFTEDENYYKAFDSVLRINRGDKNAREELLKDDFNYQTAFDGLLQGQNHPDDIPHMIKLFRRFHWLPPVSEAIDIWRQGDEKIEELTHFADSLHPLILQGNIGEEQKAEWTLKLVLLDHELTDLEVRFAGIMGDLARLVNNIFKWSAITLGLVLLLFGAWLFYGFIKSTAVWTETLRASEEKFKNVLNNSRDVLYKMDIKTKKYEYVSPALEHMLGYKPEQFEQEGIKFILENMHPDDLERMQRVVDRYEKTEQDNFLPNVQFRLKNTVGNWVWVSNARSLVSDQDGNPEAIVGSVRDISTQKKQEEQIKKSLKEKEILLQEIHHRVKNNLSIISSLLELQKEGMPQKIQDMLSSSQSRIKSIAKVHEKLYKSTTLSDIPMDVYITELSEEIAKAYISKKQRIDLRIDVDPVTMQIKKAIPFGLVLNELINNAYKHGFKDVTEGKICISLKTKEQGMELRVENTGAPLSDDFDPDASHSLGMTLIQILVKRFKGKLDIKSDEWTRFIIQFEPDDIDQPAE